MIKDFRIINKSTNKSVIEFSDATEEDLTIDSKSQKPMTFPIGLASLLKYEDSYSIEMEVRKRSSIKKLTLNPKNIHGKSQNV